MNRKKLLALLLSCIMLVSVLAGCGGEEAEEPEELEAEEELELDPEAPVSDETWISMIEDMQLMGQLMVTLDGAQDLDLEGDADYVEELMTFAQGLTDLDRADYTEGKCLDVHAQIAEYVEYLTELVEEAGLELVDVESILNETEDFDPEAPVSDETWQIFLENMQLCGETMVELGDLNPTLTPEQEAVLTEIIDFADAINSKELDRADYNEGTARELLNQMADYIDYMYTLLEG